MKKFHSALVKKLDKGWLIITYYKNEEGIIDDENNQYSDTLDGEILERLLFSKML